MFSDQDALWMKRALELAKQAAQVGEVPVGAVLVCEGKIISEAHNQVIGLNDPSAHGEVLALRKAGEKLQNYRLPNAELFVTIEPCLMCAGTMVHARVGRVVFGAREPKAGVAQSNLCVFDQDFLNHRVKFESGLLAEECSTLIGDFFKERRKNA